MSDLISRSELLKAMDNWDKFGYDEHNRLIKIDRTNEEYAPYVHYEDMVKCVNDMPTAYSVDKVIEELEKELEKGNMAIDFGEFRLFEIVKHGGVADDVCKWKSESYGELIRNPHTNGLFSNEQSMHNVYCITCGKKIKIVGD